MAVVWAAWARFQLIEPRSLAFACDAGATGILCSIRTSCVVLFVNDRLGYAAAAALLFALVLRSPALAWLAALLSAIGLILYCFDVSALVLPGAVLLLARSRHASACRSGAA